MFVSSVHFDGGGGHTGGYDSVLFQLTIEFYDHYVIKCPEINMIISFLCFYFLIVIPVGAGSTAEAAGATAGAAGSTAGAAGATVAAACRMHAIVKSIITRSKKKS